MSRLLRLYPRHWRERYGEEFQALLEELPPSRTLSADVALGALRAHLFAAPPERPLLTTQGGLVFDVRDRLPSPSLLGWLAAAVLFPGAVFLVIALLKYWLGVPAPFDALEPLYLAAKPIELATFIAPFVAFAFAVLPIVGVGVERSRGALRGSMVIELRPLNLLVAGVSTLVGTAFVAYLIVENVLAKSG